MTENPQDTTSPTDNDTPSMADRDECRFTNPELWAEYLNLYNKMYPNSQYDTWFLSEERTKEQLERLKAQA